MKKTWFIRDSSFKCFFQGCDPGRHYFYTFTTKNWYSVLLVFRIVSQQLDLRLSAKVSKNFSSLDKHYLEIDLLFGEFFDTFGLTPLKELLRLLQIR